MMERVIQLSEDERGELERRIRSRRFRADDVRRAKLILMLAEGRSYSEIQTVLGCNAGYVRRWKKRFESDGLAGLYARHQGKKAEVLTPKLEARILTWTRCQPSDGSTHWSTRRLARAMGDVGNTIALAALYRVGRARQGDAGERDVASSYERCSGAVRIACTRRRSAAT
jgi:transposase